MITTIVCAVVLAASSAHAQSQASTGQIAGCIADATGAALAGVTISVTSSATGWRREIVTNEHGCYTAPVLPVGVYELAAVLKGFRTEKATDLQVTVGSVLRVDLRLQVGTVSETVIVTNVRSSFDVASPVPSTTYDAKVIAMLPINGRRFQDLFVLTPGAQVDIQRGQLALSGQRGINANISIDGADYNQPYFGGIRGGSRSNFAPTIPQEAIQEFNVIASGHSVEFGRSSGGVVHVVTKSGTNQASGSAFYVNRHRDLAARNVFGQRSAPTQQQWGGSYGAPIRRNQSFFFAAFEQQEMSVERRVAFTALQGVTPTDETTEAFEHYRALQGPFTETNDAITMLGRLDWQPDDGNRVSLRYSGSRNVALNAISSGNATVATTTLALSSNGTERDRTHTVVGQFTRAQPSRLVFEIRGQYSREERPRDANAIEARVQNDIGRFGTTSFLGQTRTNDWRGQIVGNATWLAGTQTLKAGAELNYVFLDEIVGLNQTGVFLISPGRLSVHDTLEVMSRDGPTANRFDSTAVTYLAQIGNLQNSRSTVETALFLQDAWRVRPDLTVTYGLRWEGQWHPPPEANNRSLIDRIAPVTFPSGRRVDPTTIPDGVRPPAPRAGFAWDPGGDTRTILRGDAGVYDARSPGIIFTAPHTNFRDPPADLSVRLPFIVEAHIPEKTIYQQLALIDIDLNFPLNQLPRLTPEDIGRIAGELGLKPDPYLGAQPFVVDPGFKNPRAYQWGAGFERALGRGVTVGADYHDIRTVNLERNVDLNLPSPVIRDSDEAQRPFFGLRSGVLRPIRELGQVIVRESTARSHYRALTLRTRIRRSWGELNAFYVLSKSLSDDDNEADAGGMVAENAYDLRSEYSFARLDRRHQFSGVWIGLLPFGLEAAGSFQFRSGVPVDARVGADVNEDLSTGVDRPYRAPGVPFQRNAFRNRPTSTVDLHFRKTLTITGRRLAFTIDVFNLLNVDGLQYAGAEVTTYCASPGPTCGFDPPTHENFLQLRDRNGRYLLNNTPGEPRQMQIGLRLSF